MNLIQQNSENGKFTWTLQQYFDGAISPSVKEAAEKSMARVLGLFMCAFSTDESAALRLIEKLNQAIAFAELNQINELTAIQSERRQGLKPSNG